MTSTISSDKKPHPLTAIHGKTITTTTLFQHQPENFILAKTLKENVDTLTSTTTASSTITAQTSSHLKSKGNNTNTFLN